MFYVKFEPVRGITINAPIVDVFTQCPSCQQEVSVDLTEVLKDGCLHSSQVLCAQCSQEKMREVIGHG